MCNYGVVWVLVLVWVRVRVQVRVFHVRVLGSDVRDACPPRVTMLTIHRVGVRLHSSHCVHLNLVCSAQLCEESG